MKLVAVVGVVFIILGVVTLAYQGITYTTEKKVIDIGPIQGSVKEEKTIPLPPIMGATAVAVGTGLLLVGLRKR